MRVARWPSLGGAVLLLGCLGFVPMVSADFCDMLKNLMPDLPKAEIMLNHLQSITLIGDLNIEFPITFENSFTWMDSFALDMDALSAYGLPVLEIRWQFMLFATVMPLCLTFLMLLFFNSGYVVVWYFMFLSGIAITGCAVTLQLLPRNSDQYHGNKAFPILYMLYAGCAILVLCGSIFFINWQVNKAGMAIKVRDKNQKLKGSLTDEDYSYRKRWSVLQTLKNMLIIAIMMFVALNLAQATNPLGLDYPKEDSQPGRCH